jgi:O-antigen ligase
MTRFLFLSPLVIVALLPGDPYHWQKQTFYGLVVITMALVYWIWQRYHAVAAISLLVAVLSGLSCYLNPASHFYQSTGRVAINAFDAFSSPLFILMIVMPVALASKKMFDAVTRMLAALCYIDALYLILTFFTQSEPIGFLNVHSIDASFVAALWPMVAFRDRFVSSRYLDLGIKAVPVLAVLLSGGATGFVILFVVTAVYFMARKDTRRAAALILPIATGSAAALGYWLLGPALYRSPGRLGIWEVALTWWTENSDIWFGQGVGSFVIYGPHIQIVKKFLIGKYFLWMHNDWAQILFELGIAGFVSVATLYLLMLWRSVRTPWLLATLVGYGVFGFFQMPLRMFIPALFGACLVRLALEERETDGILP